MGRGRVEDWILNGTTPALGATTILRAICPAFNPAYAAGEDLDWWLRAVRNVEYVRYIESRDWLWRQHDGIRHGIGLERRVEGQLLLLKEHHDYFRSHRRARAFRWLRIGTLLLAMERKQGILEAAVNSLYAWPSSRNARLVLRGLSLRLSRRW
jgi:hypothetical protein